MFNYATWLVVSLGCLAAVVYFAERTYRTGRKVARMRRKSKKSEYWTNFIFNASGLAFFLILSIFFLK